MDKQKYNKHKQKIGTRAIHVGESRHSEGAHIAPIYQTGTFGLENLEEIGKAFEDISKSFLYTRFDNPNFRQIEKKIASLEQGEDCLVFSSGMAAINTTIQYLARKGGHIICTQTLYGGTDDLFTNILPQLGIKFSFVDTRDPENVRKAVKENTKVIFLETPANPTLALADIKAISEIARKKNILVVADNSFASPYNQRPLTLGADLVIHSVTKYLNGHGDLIMGAVVGNKSLLREGADCLFHWRAITGPVSGPQDCFLAERGLKTFEVRMERHNSNASRFANFLENRAEVEKVYYPGLASHSQYELAKKQMLTEEGKPGFGGMVVFELKGGIAAARQLLEYFVKNKTVVSLVISLGYIDTLIQHPATMTHAAIPREERLKKGITDGLLRVSVGIEDWEDIKKSFEQALDNINI
jgi:methionine-gamma-lyase